MQLQAGDTLRIVLKHDPVYKAVKFKINNATSVVKKSKALTVTPKNTKKLHTIEGTNYDSVAHEVMLSVVDSVGNTKYVKEVTIPASYSLKYSDTGEFYLWCNSLKTRVDTPVYVPVDGLQGETGLQGQVGLQGEQGFHGEQGFKGEAGLDGIDGLTGDAGMPGEAGIDGKDGDQGAEGVSGTSFTWRGSYEDDTTYFENDVVEHNGSSWICLIETVGITPNHNSLLWDLMALKGKDGSGGGGFATSSPAAPSTPSSNGLAYVLAMRAH